MITFTKRIKTTFAIAALAALGSQAALAQDSDQELEAVKREFIAIKNQLEAVQEKALESEQVQDAFAKADDALKAELLSTSPKKSDTIEAYFEIRSDIAAALGDDDAPIQELQQKAQKLGAKLGGSLKKASQSEAVVDAQQATKDAILAAMKEIEPETEQLLDRQSQLYARYQKLTQQS